MQLEPDTDRTGKTRGVKDISDVFLGKIVGAQEPEQDQYEGEHYD
jgi:hypothetical protein